MELTVTAILAAALLVLWFIAQTAARYFVNRAIDALIRRLTAATRVRVAFGRSVARIVAESRDVGRYTLYGLDTPAANNVAPTALVGDRIKDDMLPARASVRDILLDVWRTRRQVLAPSERHSFYDLAVIDAARILARLTDAFYAELLRIDPKLCKAESDDPWNEQRDRYIKWVAERSETTYVAALQSRIPVRERILPVAARN